MSVFNRVLKPIIDQALQEPGLNVERKCNACGAVSWNTVPAVPTAPYVAGNDGTQGIPPFVCVDFRTCCNRYRQGLSPSEFLTQVPR